MKNDLIRKFFLEANLREDRRGCPDEAMLKAIAENRLPIDHPARLHLGSCSDCFAEFSVFKMEAQDRRRLRWIRASAVAACLLVSFAVWRSPLLHFARTAPRVSPGQPVEEAAVSRQIDISGYGTMRGDRENAGQFEALSLPTAVVHLKIILPLFSPGGHYKVAVAVDRTGDKTLATGEGTATQSDRSAVVLNVTLDLRKVPRGSYFLSTERQEDAGAHYYPLKLQ